LEKSPDGLFFVNYWTLLFGYFCYINNINDNN
jgi:hypothetical protein